MLHRTSAHQQKQMLYILQLISPTLLLFSTYCRSSLGSSLRGRRSLEDLHPPGSSTTIVICPGTSHIAIRHVCSLWKHASNISRPTITLITVLNTRVLVPLRDTRVDTTKGRVGLRVGHNAVGENSVRVVDRAFHCDNPVVW